MLFKRLILQNLHLHNKRYSVRYIGQIHTWIVTYYMQHTVSAKNFAKQAMNLDPKMSSFKASQIKVLGHLFDKLHLIFAIQLSTIRAIVQRVFT